MTTLQESNTGTADIDIPGDRELHTMWRNMLNQRGEASRG